MTYYIQIIAPMDSGFVGPFKSREAAQNWIGTYPSGHDCCIMTETEYRDNIAQYGQPDWSAEPFTNS